MSTVVRCTCIPHYQDTGAGLTEYVPEPSPSCSEHGEVDHILASGEYFDRKGELWHQCECPADGCGNWHMHHPSRGITPAQMRLLIERDQHRDECRGMRDCQDHPVPRVFKFSGPFGEWSAIASGYEAGRDQARQTYAEAMRAAQAMAVRDV